MNFFKEELPVTFLTGYISIDKFILKVSGGKRESLEAFYA